MLDKAKSDTLYGLKAVASHAGMTPRQAKHRATTGELPTFKMGKTVCARRSDIDAWLSDLAASARKAANQ